VVQGGTIGALPADISVYMKPKQREMDGILEKIYNSFTTDAGDRTLMVVCGDHGMNDVVSLCFHLT